MRGDTAVAFSNLTHYLITVEVHTFREDQSDYGGLAVVGTWELRRVLDHSVIGTQVLLLCAN
jgi:hypothetical protein